MKLCIYEDETFANFYPLSYLRPVFELKAGATSLAEKARRSLGNPETVYCVRDILKETFEARAGGSVNDTSALSGDDVLFLNGRALLVGKGLSFSGDEEVGLAEEEIAYVRAKAATVGGAGGGGILDLVRALAGTLPKKEAGVELVRFPWDLVHHNARAVVDDFEREGRSGIEGEMHESAVIFGPEENIYLAQGASVEPQCVIDTRSGPVTIDEGAVVGAFTRIEGPCCIGKGSQTFRANIREGCSIGPVCRVGGEIEGSIFHGRSNKYHKGFLGHAYVCEWVNLGGLCTDSDLKNDYSTVSVWCNAKLVDTGMTKVGAFIGDHVKTSIGTMLNTGTVIGILANVVGIGARVPKFIPTNSLFVDGKITKGFGISKSLETARAAMSRRGVVLSDAEERLIRAVADMTKEERNRMVKRDRAR